MNLQESIRNDLNVLAKLDEDKYSDAEFYVANQDKVSRFDARFVHDNMISLSMGIAHSDDYHALQNAASSDAWNNAPRTFVELLVDVHESATEYANWNSDIADEKIASVLDAVDWDSANAEQLNDIILDSSIGHIDRSTNFAVINKSHRQDAIDGASTTSV
jgi:hypothetical protein